MLLSVLALCTLGVAPDVVEDRPWRIEAPLLLTAGAPASNVETTVLPWASLRVGRMFNVDHARFLWGADASVNYGEGTDGTGDVAARRTIWAGELRALLAPAHIASTFAALFPYGFAGVGGGAGVTQVSVFDDVRYRGFITWQARVGAGGELRVHAWTVRVETGIGLRELRPETSASVALGVAF